MATTTKPKATEAQKEQARKARKGADIAKSKKKVGTKKTAPTTAPVPTTPNLTTRNASELEGIGGVSFRAADYITGDIWVPNPAIPAIDEATHEKYKTQAEGQARSLEVASLNLKNINTLHKLEGQAAEIATTKKANETKWAKLEGAEIAYQAQLQANGEAQQRLIQATAKHQAATRETDYTTQLIGLKDQNFQLDIQQAQTMFNEKAARYQAALAD